MAKAAKAAIVKVEVEFISKGCDYCIVITGVIKDEVA